MRTKFSPFIWTAILLILPAGLYLWYVSVQRERINEDNQRELGRAAYNLEQIVDNAVVTVRNLSARPGYACDFDEQQPYLSLLGESCEAFSGSAGNEQAITPVLRRTGRRLEIAIDAVRSTRNKPLVFEVLVGRILDDLVATEAFESLFIADGKGDVFFEVQRGDRKRWERDVRWLEQHATDDSTTTPGALRLRNASQLPTPAGAPLDVRTLATASASADVRLGGSDYRLYVQPLEFAPASGGASLNSQQAEAGRVSPEMGGWVLGAMVGADYSTREALVIDPFLTLALALMVSVGLMTWPVVELWALSAHERLKFTDAYMLLISTSAFLIVSTILLFDFDSYRRFNREATSGLEELAERLARTTVSELKAMRAQLVEFDRNVSDKGVRPIDCEVGAEPTELWLPPEKRSVKPAQATALPRSLIYPGMVFAFWTDPDGRQVIKASTSKEGAPRVDVSKRAYFREAAAGHLWAFKEPGGELDAGPRFFVQPFRSITTGDFNTALSMRSSAPGCAGSESDHRPLVAALTSPLVSLGAQPLPAGYGFMVVDRSGSVLYHSDVKRALRENVLEEVSSPGRLRSMILTGVTRQIETGYNARRHQLYVRPLTELAQATDTHQSNQSQTLAEPAGWSIIAFRDLEFARTANGEAVVSALIWAFVYIVLVQVLPVSFLLFTRGRRAPWLWPSDNRKAFYRELSLTLAALAVATMCAMAWLNGRPLLAVAWVSPVAGVTATVMCYRRSRIYGQDAAPGSGNRPRLTRPAIRWAKAAVALLYLVLAVLPAAGFFKLSWTREFGRLLRYEAVHLQQQRADLEISMNEALQDHLNRSYGGNSDPAIRPLVLQSWRSFVQTEPLPPFLATPHSMTLARDELKVIDYKPVYNHASAWLRYQPPQEDSVVQAGITAVPGVATAFGLALLVAGLVSWTRYCARAVFLSDVDEQRYDLAMLTAAIQRSNCNVLAVGGSVCQVLEIESALKAPQAARAAAATAGMSADQASGTDIPAPVGAFHTLNLDTVMGNPDQRRFWLSELERVIAAGQRVVLLAAFDYRDALSGGGSGLTVSHLDHAAALPDMQADELQRWNRWMSGFSVIHAGSDFKAEEQSAGDDPEAIEGFYRSLWNACTDTEKLVLVHVAVEGFANPAQKVTVTHLLRRGLLVMRPDLRVFSQGFEQFIRSSHDQATIARWERPPGAAGWGRTRWIFWSVLIAVAIFLLSTQRQWLSPAVGFVSSFAAALAAVLKLVSDFSRTSRGVEQ